VFDNDFLALPDLMDTDNHQCVAPATAFLQLIVVKANGFDWRVW
jgi:hypothetical protein